MPPILHLGGYFSGTSLKWSLAFLMPLIGTLIGFSAEFHKRKPLEFNAILGREHTKI
jgi:hypothetical protein